MGFRDSDLWPSHKLWPDQNAGKPKLAGRCQSPYLLAAGALYIVGIENGIKVI